MQKLLLLLLCLSIGELWAQNRVITGRVRDQQGGPVSSASIIAKGTTLGTTSREDGSFSISVPASVKTLVFSALNVPVREVAIGAGNNFDVTLSIGSRQLDEVVVTALGIVKDKRSLGYATQTIKNEDLIDKGEINIVSALQGKVAGVDITGASGSVGSSVNINIRGISSFTGNNQPLFVVDGIPISNDVDRTGTSSNDQQPPNRALDLNLNDIESVNVLKGPAAAALYGQRGASGAIIITTKRGAAGKGKIKVALASSYSQQAVYGLPQFQNEYGQGANGQYNPTSTFSFGPKFGSTPTLSNGLLLANGTTVDYRPYPNNIRNFFENAATWDNNLNVSSGDKNQNVNFTIGNTDQHGIIPNTNLNRTTVGFSFNSALSEKLNISSFVNYTGSKQVGVVQGNGAQSALFQLFSVPRSFDLDFYRDNYKKPDGTNNWPLSSTRDNPYFAAFEDPLTSRISRAMGNITVGYNVSSWLNVAYRLGIDFYSDRRTRIAAISSSTAPAGRVTEDNFFRSEFNGDLLVTAKKDNIFKDINASLLVGQNINNRNYQNITVVGDNLGIPNFYNVSNAGVFSSSGEFTRRQRLLGYYGQLNLAYKNYLFVELTGRADQTSTLAPGNNTFFYPGIATSFVFSDAFGLKGDILSYGKLRASVAKVGKDAAPYLLSNVYTSWSFGNNVGQFVFPYGSTLGFGASANIANPNLTSEFTTAYEVGGNFGLLKNRINIDAAYFYSSSTRQIVNVGIPNSTGYNSFSTNLGEMVNKGVELLVNASIVKGKRFSWDATANFTRIRNKVVSIGNGITSFQIPNNTYGGGQFTGNIASIIQGRPYGVVVGSKWQRSPDGQFLINPVTGTLLGQIAGQEIADPNKDLIAGLTNTFKFSNVFFSFLLDYKQGGDIVSWTASTYRATGALEETGVDREQPRIIPGVIKTADGKYIPNTIQIPAQTYWNSLSSGSASGEFSVFDATTFRVREVSLGVDLTGSKISSRFISNIRFTVFGRNLFYYAPNCPVDPEVSTQGANNIRGIEWQSAPNARTFGASLRASF